MGKEKENKYGGRRNRSGLGLGLNDATFLGGSLLRSVISVNELMQIIGNMSTQ